MSVWGIMHRWSAYDPVEIVKETEKTVVYRDRRWNRDGRETRTAKSSFLDWRGGEDAARAACAKLISARAEYDRRIGAASDWFKARKAEILAPAIPSRRADDAEGGSAGTEGSAVPKGDAQTQSRRSNDKL